MLEQNSGKLQCSFFAQHILDLVKCASHTDYTTALTTQQCGSFYFFQLSKTASFSKKCEAVLQSRFWPLNSTPALRRLWSRRFVALHSVHFWQNLTSWLYCGRACLVTSLATCTVCTLRTSQLPGNIHTQGHAHAGEDADRRHSLAWFG